MKFVNSANNVPEFHSDFEVIEDDFETFDFSNLQANAILFAGSLAHIEYSKLANLIEKIVYQTQALAIYLSLKEGAGVKSAADGRKFYLWDDKVLRELFKRVGFHVNDFSRSASLIKPKDIWLGYVLGKS